MNQPCHGMKRKSEYDFIDQIGGTYETGTYSDKELSMRIKILNDFLRYDDGKTLVDIGCSNGSWAFYFLGAGYDVTGVDISEERLKEADQRGYNTMLASATDLPFKNNAFDTAVMQGVLVHILNKDDRRKAVQEAIRVTKPNGIIILSIASKDGHWFEKPTEYCAYETRNNILEYAEGCEEVDNVGIHFSPFMLPIDAGRFCRVLFMKFEKVEE